MKGCVFEMMIHRELSNKLYSVILSSKRVGTVATSEDQFWKFISTINIWNRKSKGIILSSKYNQAEYVIPNFLSDLILPEWISFTGSTMERNLYPDKVQLPEGNADLLSPLDFNNVGRSLCGSLKIGTNDSEVAALRHTTAKFADVATKQVKDGYVRYSSDAFRPVQMCDWYVYPDAAYNTNADDVFVTWFEDVITKAVQR